VDCLFTSCGFEEFCNFYSLTLGLDAPSPSFSVMPTSNVPAMTSPPLVVSSTPLVQITPSVSQPGSQEEQIRALQNLDDLVLSSKKGSEESEDREKTPIKVTIEEPQSASTGGGSAEKRPKRSKRVTSKKRKLVSYSPPTTSAGEAGKEGDPSTLLSSSSARTPSDRPKKLAIKSGSDSKGSGKKT